ncbi:MAG: WxcM-like domain-containing protein [Erysipelotrichaceae bacterium]|nr:WxcM-like domain-containing protein [Erysipelotrichaceae bacterium]
MEIKILNFEEHGDERGTLISLEQMKNIPFEIKRIYYMYENGKYVRRGFHAHKELKQVLICVAGSCKIHLDNGSETEEVLLDNPSKGLVIESNIWREMYDFTPGAVLLVVASELYDESDYIRNYDDFIKYIGK